MQPHPRTPFTRQHGAAGSLVLLAVVIAAALWWFRPWEGMRMPGTTPEAVPRAVTARGTLAEDEQNNISVFKTVSPSVVHITTIGLQRNFFSADITQVPRGTGTGFMWDDNGHIVTNFHVIEGASGARVTLNDQSTWKAGLVGAFPDRDLAVLRIDAPKEKIRPILLGVSRDLQVGQKVYAIGNPFGLDQSLTTGIVSALEREIEAVTKRTIRGVIQTDAAINPGNSGGPLIDMSGRVVGINSSIRTASSGGSIGLGFAIPIDEVLPIVNQINDGQTPTHARLGVSVSDSRDALRQGALLREVENGGAADQAGLEVDDVITKVDEHVIDGSESLVATVRGHRPGDEVEITYVRDGKTATTTADLGSDENNSAS